MSTSRILVSSGTEFEATVGYSRAVRVGAHVAVSGTTASGASRDIGAQTREVLRRIEIALTEAGAALGDVVRTRIRDRHCPLARGRGGARRGIRRNPTGGHHGRGGRADRTWVPGGDRGRRLLAECREHTVGAWQVAGDVDHSVNGQGAVQMREHHRLRIRCYP
jgi:hypothetical protein